MEDVQGQFAVRGVAMDVIWRKHQLMQTARLFLNNFLGGMLVTGELVLTYFLSWFNRGQQIQGHVATGITLWVLGTTAGSIQTSLCISVFQQKFGFSQKLGP